MTKAVERSPVLHENSMFASCMWGGAATVDKIRAPGGELSWTAESSGEGTGAHNEARNACTASSKISAGGLGFASSFDNPSSLSPKSRCTGWSALGMTTYWTDRDAGQVDKHGKRRVATAASSHLLVFALHLLEEL
eukprot:scaffold48_cov311-Pinguiococcus_pyrenoidosus.AAC.153